MGVRALCAVLFAVTSAAAALAAEAVWPMPDWAKATPAQVGMDEAKLIRARDYALGGDGSAPSPSR